MALIIIASLATCAGCQSEMQAPQRAESVKAMTQEAILSSNDPKVLYQEASRIARSSQEADLALLQQRLTDPGFLARLDSEEAYRDKPERLRVAGVLQSLSTNRAPAARSALMALTVNSVFLNRRQRVRLLIQALEPVRPATNETLAFWDRHCQPGDGYSNITIDTVIKNGTAPALTVFEKNIVNPAHPEEDRYSWLVVYVLQHRNDLPLLQSCERVLRGRLEQKYKVLLVDVLFDYKPEEWYRACGWVKAPPRQQAMPDALRQLRTVGKMALEDKGTAELQRKQVQVVIEEINQRLNER